MEDAEFGLMLAAALDAIHASVLDCHEWSSRVLSNGNFLCLDNHGDEWIFVWHFPNAKKQRLHDEMVATYEKSEVASHEMTEASEKCEASLKSVDNERWRVRQQFAAVEATGGQGPWQALRGPMDVHDVSEPT